MIHQTPIAKDADILLTIQARAAFLREVIEACEPDEENTSCVIELNDCEKILDLVEWHREQYEPNVNIEHLEVVDAEIIEAHEHAQNFGMPAIADNISPQTNNG